MSSNLIVSEYNEENYPLFSSFLKLYYEYSNIRTNASGAIQHRYLDSNIDETLDVYLNEFYSTYGKQLPKNSAFDRRNLIKLLNAVYEAKGTENAFKLLFKLLYDEKVSLTYPSENILKASDGIWYQESFILAATIIGDPALTIDKEIRIISQDVYFIRPIRIERVNESDVRLYFVKTSNMNVAAGNVIEFYNGNTLEYKSTIKESPVGLKIHNPGQNFELGQIYSIAGSSQPTIFKIKSINSNGGILATEIINHGFEHQSNITTFISPYKAPPSSSDTSINVIETAPGVFTIEIGITDTIFDISETIDGFKTGNSLNSYFLQDYVMPDYNGSTIISQTIKSDANLTDFAGAVESYGITIQDYLNSRAYISIVYAPLISKQGSYKNNQGHISDQSVRIQDNHYYQLFSYVLHNNLDISTYRDTVMSVLHPAGLKAFFNYSVEDEIDVNSDITVDGKFIYRLDVFDEVTQIETINKNISKTEAANITLIETPSKTISKTETASTTVIETTPTKTIRKDAPELITATEVVNKTNAKTLNDILSSVGYAETYFNAAYTETSGMTETFDLQTV